MSILICYCDCCDLGILSFYRDYLIYVKKFSASEVDHKMMSQRRVLQHGTRIIDHFMDTLFLSDSTVTSDGDDLVSVWEIVKDGHFCERQVASWKKQMLARKLIQE